MTGSVHVVGAHGLGETLVSLLADFSRDLGISEVTFQRRAVLETDKARLKALLDKGALVAAEGAAKSELERLGLEVSTTPRAALEKAHVVVDATALAGTLKDSYAALKNARGVIALQADVSFGPAVAHGVNLAALRRGVDRLVRVASAPAQGMALLTAALAGSAGSRTASAVEGRFVSLMRSSDVGAAVDLPATLVLRTPVHAECGADDAVTAEALLHGAGARVPITAQAAELNQQLMHVLTFGVTLREDVSTADALARLAEAERVALTEKLSPNPVFAFGRDHGYAGRMFNVAVVPRGALWVRNGREVMGAAWLPPEGSELYTAAALVLWFLEGETALRRLDALKPYVFKDV